MFFLRATSQPVLNFLPLIGKLPLHLLPIWQWSTHEIFPPKNDLAKIFYPDYPNYWVALCYFFWLSIQRRRGEKKKRNRKQGEEVSRIFNLKFSNIFCGVMFIFSILVQSKRPCQLKGCEHCNFCTGEALKMPTTLQLNRLVRKLQES